MSTEVKNKKWVCTEHDQSEWECANAGDEYYHMKRVKEFEYPAGKSVLDYLTTIPPKSDKP